MATKKIFARYNTSTVHSIEVDSEAYDKWKEGWSAQDAFPELTPFELELIITGECKEDE